MYLELLNWLVSITGVLMSAAHFPQAYKIWKRKSARDLSLLTYSTFTLGAYVWLAYGIVLQEWPIIVSFVVSVIGTTSVLVLMLKYR